MKKFVPCMLAGLLLLAGACASTNVAPYEVAEPSPAPETQAKTPLSPDDAVVQEKTGAAEDAPDRPGESYVFQIVRTPVEKRYVLPLPTEATLEGAGNSLSETIQPIMQFLEEHPQATIEVEAHAWSNGPELNTLTLTRIHAENIKKFLAYVCPIPEQAITATGYGSSRPAGQGEPQKRVVVRLFGLEEKHIARQVRRTAASSPESAREKAGESAKEPVNLRFQYGESILEPDSAEELNQLAEHLLKNPESRAVIEGHTDSKGSDQSNLALSRQRAETVKSFLTDTHGIDPARLEVMAYGEGRPVADNATEQGRALNRRVAVTLLGPEETHLAFFHPGPEMESGQYRIEISISQCKLWLYEVFESGEEVLLHTFDVATAREGWPYPKGEGRVVDIQFDPWWHPTANMIRRAAKEGKTLHATRPGSSANPMGAFKIILSHGNGYRIHGTNKPSQIGKRVSQGCIRMHNDEGLLMARLISVGTEVNIIY